MGIHRGLEQTAVLHAIFDHFLHVDDFVGTQIDYQGGLGLVLRRLVEQHNRKQCGEHQRGAGG